MITFLIYPLTRLASTAWSTETLNALTSSTLWQVALLASAQAILSVGLSLLLGIPIARMLFTYQFPGRGFILALVTVPFVLPTVVVALGFRSLFGNSITNGLLLVVLAHAYINIAVVIRLIGAQWSTLDRRMEVTAATLGASPLRVFTTITLPGLRNSIVLAASVVFIFSFSSLGIVVVLGDGSGTRTLEQVILRSTSVLLDFPTALAAAILQLLVVSLVFVISARISRNEPRAKVVLERETIRDRQTALLVWVTCLAGILLVLAPIASIFWASISSSGGLTSQWWNSLFSVDNTRIGSPVAALGRSIGLALFTSVIAAILGGAIAIAVMSKKGIVATLALIPHGDGGELPERRHETWVRVRGEATWAVGEFLAEAIHLRFGQSAFNECAGIDSRGGVTLVENLVGAFGVLGAFEKVVEANFVESCRAGVGGNMSTNGYTGALGAVHHDRGIPADHCADPAFYKFVPWKPWLVIRCN